MSKFFQNLTNQWLILLTIIATNISLHWQMLNWAKRGWSNDLRMETIERKVNDTWTSPMIADISTATHSDSNSVVMSNRDLQDLVSYISKKYNR
jgi:hypothetical protein